VEHQPEDVTREQRDLSLPKAGRKVARKAAGMPWDAREGAG
jgi:hypothetical protein